MLLSFDNGQPFATGRMPYDYPPPGSGEATVRIVVTITIGGQQTRAILDTASPYVICDPRLIPFIPTRPYTILEETRIQIRGISVYGTLHRLPVTFLATVGDDLQVDATFRSITWKLSASFKNVIASAVQWWQPPCLPI